MTRLMSKLFVAGSFIAIASLGRVGAQGLPPAPVPIGSDGTAAPGSGSQYPSTRQGAVVPNYTPPQPYNGQQYGNPVPPPPAPGLSYDAPPPYSRLGPPPDPTPLGQQPPPRLGPPPDSSMTAPPYPPPQGPPPFVTPEQAAERERIFFLSWSERPGWFFNVETAIVGPHVMNRLGQTINLSDGETDPIHLPSAELGGTLSPRFELGYRFGENKGALLVSYRFLTIEGSVTDVDEFSGLPTGSMDSRLDMQTIDFDYATRDFQLGANWEVRGRVGARIGYAYFDSKDNEVFVPDDPTQPLLFDGIKTSNRFVGAGPHALVELERHIGRHSSLSTFARVEGSLLIGQVKQDFEETLVQGSDSAFGSVSPTSTQVVPVLQTELGLRWRPTWHDNIDFAMGYTYEQWWGLGNAAGSKAEIWSQGFFFRGEFMF
jgi:Legionella pneumophila major outer membrane protein precursor